MDFNKNYYATLGVNKDSTPEEIKSAYRKLAKEHHPDVSKTQDDAVFKELNESYSVIGDDGERQKYDVQSPYGKNYQPGFGNGFFRMNINGQDFNPFGGFGFDPFGGGGPFQDPFFRDIFNRKEEFIENLDIHFPVDITLKDVYNNNNISIKFKHDVKCDVCGFTGFDPNSEAFTCDACDGKGGDGFTKCKYCGGTGKIHSGPCPKCATTKVTTKDEEFAFSNTFAIDKNFQKYMRGLGHQSKHYANKVGTLIIDANYVHDIRYVREGPNLTYLLNLHYQHAIDGYDFEHEHLDNKKYSIKIPPKTKDGDILRIAGKGLLMNAQQRGDLLVKVNIVIDYELLK